MLSGLAPATVLDALEPRPGGVTEGGSMSLAVSTPVRVVYQPILDVARGAAAGFQAQPVDAVAAAGQAVDPTRAAHVAAAVAAQALSAFSTLPPNTFVSIPLATSVATSPLVRSALSTRADLSGVVLEIIGFSGSEPIGAVEDVLTAYRERGASIAVGGQGAAQPELTSIVRLKPTIIRLGRDWTRGIDRSETKRSAIEVTGRLAGQLDACILADGVESSAELRALANLEVPLAQGPFVGEPQARWPEIEMTARTALPTPMAASDGVLRGLLQQAYTATNEAAARAVLPETTGFDVLVVLDAHRRPVTLIERDTLGIWDSTDVLAVNIDTGLSDAVGRAMARPRPTRFAPVVCTDNAGRFLGILRIERLVAHLAESERPTS